MQKIITRKSITEHRIYVVRPEDGSYIHRTVLLYYSLREGKHSSAAPHMQLKIFSLRYFFSTFMLSLLQHTLPSQSIPADRFMPALQACYWF